MSEVLSQSQIDALLDSLQDESYKQKVILKEENEKKEYRRYWRTWSHFTQADTYIEHRFEYMCRSLSNGEKIVNEC